MGTYIVRTPEFEGPFDLLMHLIARQRVDLWRVSLAAITRDYVAEIRRMRELDLQVASEFLVVAATLLELKAARLLPTDDPDGDQVEVLLSERDLLFARLLQYQAYKQVAGLLAGRLAAQAGYRPRTAGAAEVLAGIVPDLLAGLAPADLARAAARAMTPPPPPPLAAEHVAPPPRLSLAETVQDLVGELERLRQTTFRALVGPSPLPVEVVVRFLALLELYKRSVVDLDQPAAFDDIAVRWTGEAGADAIQPPIQPVEPPP
jgi:segregation and condensation protein A